MNQETVLYGKNNPSIVPELEIWGLPISLYLFLGGLAAGILFFTSVLYLLKRDEKQLYSYQRVMMLASLSLIVGVLVLLFDLHKIVNSWRLYTHFDLAAPMSWGAWTLLAIIPLALVWGLPFQSRFFMNNKVIQILEPIVLRFRWPLALMIAVLAIILGMYTGMLLSDFTARPLWNSNFLPLLFLFSGLSAGIAALIWLGRDPGSQQVFRKIDIALIAGELVLFAIYLIDLYTGTSAQVTAANYLVIGGQSFVFWIFVVFAGLLLPFYVELKEIRGARFPGFIAPLLVIAGSLIFRIVIVEAGQLPGI